MTVNGRAEVVLLDTETYESLMEQIRSAEGIATVGAVVRAAKCAGPEKGVAEAEIERCEALVKKIMAETERLGLYK